MDEGNGFAAEPPNQNKILGWGYLGITVCGFCPDSIFCTSLPFITKLGVVVHHHKLESCAFFFSFFFFIVAVLKVTVRAYMIRLLLFLQYLLN